VIKTSGHLIGPFEVESALLEHPAVAEAGVIGKPDPVAMEIVKAFVALKPGYQANEELKRALLAHARGWARLSRPKRSNSETSCRAHAAARSCAVCSRRKSWGCRKATPQHSKQVEPTPQRKEKI
jgi:acyl-CoA synthetase (AMP-forming)/AMP-acid ligase II